MSDLATNDLLGVPLRQLADAIADKTPTPGGGAVGGVVGVLATALAQMSLNFTRGRKKFAAHQEMYDALTRRFARARGMYEQLAQDDAQAYALYRAAKDVTDPQEQAQATALALAAAIDVPRQLAKLSLALLEDLRKLTDCCNPYLLSDLMAAAALAAAAVRMSDYNVQANTRQLPEVEQAHEILSASGADIRRADLLLGAIEERAGRLIAD